MNLNQLFAALAALDLESLEAAAQASRAPSATNLTRDGARRLRTALNRLGVTPDGTGRATLTLKDALDQALDVLTPELLLALEHLASKTGDPHHQQAWIAVAAGQVRLAFVRHELDPASASPTPFPADTSVAEIPAQGTRPPRARLAATLATLKLHELDAAITHPQAARLTRNATRSLHAAAERLGRPIRPPEDAADPEQDSFEPAPKALARILTALAPLLRTAFAAAQHPQLRAAGDAISLAYAYLALARDAQLGEGVIEYGALHIDLTNGQAHTRATALPLTVWEFRVLVELARASGRAVSRRTLHKRLGLDPDSRTLPALVAQLRRKLHDDDGDAAVRISGAKNRGYRLHLADNPAVAPRPAIRQALGRSARKTELGDPSPIQPLPGRRNRVGISAPTFHFTRHDHHAPPTSRVLTFIIAIELCTANTVRADTPLPPLWQLARTFGVAAEHARKARRELADAQLVYQPGPHRPVFVGCNHGPGHAHDQTCTPAARLARATETLTSALEPQHAELGALLRIVKGAEASATGLVAAADAWNRTHNTTIELTPDDTDHILTAVTGRQPHSPIEFGALRIYPGSQQAYKRDRTLNLTPREFTILLELARNPGHLVTHETLHQQLNSYRDPDQSLRRFVGRLRSKLDDNDGDAAVRISAVTGRGYRLHLADDPALAPPPAICEALGLHLDPTTQSAERHGRDLDLRPTDYDLLVYLLNHTEQTLTREQIAAEAQPRRTTTAASTRAQLSALKFKLGEPSPIQHLPGQRIRVDIPAPTCRFTRHDHDTAPTSRVLTFIIAMELCTGDTRAGMALPLLHELTQAFGCRRDQVHYATRELTAAKLIRPRGTGYTAVVGCEHAHEQAHDQACTPAARLARATETLTSALGPYAELGALLRIVKGTHATATDLVAAADAWNRTHDTTIELTPDDTDHILTTTTGRRPHSPIEFGALRIYPNSQQAYKRDQTLNLTPRELTVLLELARAPGQLVTHETLHQHLGLEPNGNRAMYSVVRKLRAKLHDDGDAAVTISPVHRRGYRLHLPDDPWPHTPHAIGSARSRPSSASPH